MNTMTLVSLSNPDLLDATRALALRACEVEADLLVHLAEIDERKLYLQNAFPSMFAFCVGELGFSEDAAYSRILVARAAVIEALRSQRVHRSQAAHRAGSGGRARAGHSTRVGAAAAKVDRPAARRGCVQSAVHGE
ncbi:MAG: hypothetical protein LC689_11455 [Myxococcales bacterium]|nr:hypothetical protein [Myxococcales bacterium]